MLSSRIAGIGGYLPPRCVSNKELETVLDTTDEWIQQRTGIVTRHWVPADMATSDMALEASLVAIQDAQIDRSEIDMIITANSSPDHDIPGTGPFLQAKLKLPGVPVFEIRQACAGFVYGLTMADQFIKSGHKKCILLIGVELQSKFLDMSPAGRAVSVIFADGAGAVVIKAVEKKSNQDSHILAAALHTDGEYAKDLWVPAPGTACGPSRVNPGMFNEGQFFLQMNARYVFSQATTRMPEVLNEACQMAKINFSEIDFFFFHQANMRINEKIMNDLKIPSEKIHNTIQKWGNTTAATIPLGMWDAKNLGLLKRGQLLGLSAFGAGFSWGAILMRY